MSHEIKVLLLEDMPDDADLALYELSRAGFKLDSMVVQNEDDFRRELDHFNPNLVLSDFSLPGFGGMPALSITREKFPDLPFVFVSGTIGEERAIESFKRGATDYVLKTNLSRLGPVVQRALQEANERAARRKAEQDLQENEEKFRAIVETSQEWMWEVDKEGLSTFNSPFVHTILGYRPEELLGATRFTHMHPEDRRMFESLMVALNAEHRGWNNLILRWQHKDSSYRSLESNAIPLFNAEGKVIGYRGTDRDVTERIRQQEKIARLSRINAVSSSINATIVRVRDREELFREACRIAVEQGEFRLAWIGVAEPGDTKATPVAWMGLDEQYLDEVRSALSEVDKDQGTAIRAIREKKLVVSNNIETDPQVIFKKQALSRGFRALVALPLLLGNNAVAVMVLYAGQLDFFDDQELKLLGDLAADISFALDNIEKEERLDYLSYYDALTGLPNRILFRDRVDQLLHAPDAEEHKLAVLVIDLERFRNVNETLGRHAGDELLQLIAQRLKAMLPEGCNPARLGGDYFAVAFPLVKDEADIAHLVEQKLIGLFLQTLVVAGVQLRTPARFGIAVFPTDGSDAESLIMNAESALKKAKSLGDKYAFYTREMHARISERLTLENNLRRGLEEGQFILHYQPKFDLKSKRMAGMEALIRWQSPKHGLVPPDQFVSLLEETGLIVEVGRWVMEKAIADYWELSRKGLKPPRIAVNVSALQLRQRGFVDQIAQAIEKGGRGCDIDIEVTESIIMDDLEGSIEKLNSIKALGIAISLDDFGTGFSSLRYLMKLPLDSLKIDKAFIVDMTRDADSLTIVSAIISLAHSLNLKVIAEGVETEEQSNLLRLLKCDEIQGNYFSHAVPLLRIEEMLREGTVKK